MLRGFSIGIELIYSRFCLDSQTFDPFQWTMQGKHTEGEPRGVTQDHFRKLESINKQQQGKPPIFRLMDV